jgi:hypothetical protein
MKFLIVLVFLGLVGFGLNRFVPSDTAAYPQKAENGQNKEGATPIQVGVMTKGQKEHSKLYERYKPGRKLDVFPAPGESSADDEQGVYIEPPLEITSPDAPELSFEDFLTDLTCAADAVVTVVVKDRASQLTENKEFIFTDYTAVVEEVFRGTSLTPNTTITVTRPGGKVQIDGHIVGAVDSSFKVLEPGKHYLLFLQNVPATGAYQSVRKGSFLLEDSDLISLTDQFIPGINDETKRAPIVRARSALSSGCKR